MSASADTAGRPAGWFPACWSHELRRRPLRRLLDGRALVLFRTADGQPTALSDRCPHRGYPLSAGRVENGSLRCGYHGWRFAGDGRTLEVPCRPGPAEHPTRRAAAHACHEEDGLVWSWTGTGEPDRPAPVTRPPDSARYATLRHATILEAGLQPVLENILDVPHTAFLHGGLFRGRRPAIAITAEVRRGDGAVEAYYRGEPAPLGLAGRLLAPAGATLEHIDRFRLPAIAEVDYRAGDDGHLLVTSALCPEGPDRTRLYAIVRLRARLPARPLLWLAAPLLWWILRQDALALARLTDNARRFPDARDASTEIDVLGPEIARLLRGAATADEGERQPKVVQLLV